MALEAVGGVVAEAFHAVAAFDQGLALRQEALQLDRADFRAVLFGLAALLGVLVAVEFALEAVGGAMEQVDGRPQQVFEVGFEAGVAKGGDQGVKNVGDGAADGVGFGQGPQVRLVAGWTIAVEFKFGEDAVGRG